MQSAVGQVLVTPGTRPFPEDSWQGQTIEQFERRMLDRADQYPCIFGADAVAKGTLRYAFISAASQAHELASALTGFTEVCEQLGKRTSLVCFFETWAAEKEHEHYYQRFWSLLWDTSRLDPKPWNEAHSRDTSDPSFEYCFNGVPMFVVANTDIHENRRSRYFNRVAITFQPRFVFDDIQPGTKAGENARRVIRDRLKRYDPAVITEMLGDFGDPTNQEWRQYYLDDGSDSIARGKCPVKFHKA